MADPPAARLVHASHGRLRLRLPGLRGDGARLAALALAASHLPGVVAAEASVVTGSLLLLHRSTPEALVQALEAGDVLTLRPDGPEAGSAAGPIRMDVLLPAAGAATATALALLQLLRKEALPPALTLGIEAARLARSAMRARRGGGADVPEPAP